MIQIESVLTAKKTISAIKDFRESVPVWHKFLLTLTEAANYFGIGINKLRDMSNESDCSWVTFIGSKRMIVRPLLEDYLKEAFIV